MKTSHATDSPPDRGRYDRFRNEVMAGGSVTEPDPTEDEDQPVSPLTAAIAGIVIFGLLTWLAVTNGWMFVFVIGILVSVFLHETGHFVTARMTGMKATQFFLGFGPRLWSFRRGETEYGVRALPLGAFVRIIGMNNMDDVPPADEARTYRQATYPRRMLVISAGSLMHLLIAIVLLFSVYSIRGEFVDTAGAEVGAVQESGPAAVAGIQDGDVVLQIDGVPVDGPEELGEAVRAHQPGDVVEVTVQRDGAEQTIPVSLGANTDESSPMFGAALLGVSSRTPGEWQSMSLGDAATSSVVDLFPMAWENTKGVVQVLNPVNIVNHLSGATDDLETRPTTVVGVTQVSGAIGDAEGLIGVLFLLAALNVFVGVFNMFPLLPLDGGHAAIATYERVRERGGRRYFADVSRLMPFAMGVIVLLLALFMSGLYLDITQPLR
ncbi:MAG: site-2 protease family protein [Ilumatobacteraceae bacterium]